MNDKPPLVIWNLRSQVKIRTGDCFLAWWRYPCLILVPGTPWSYPLLHSEYTTSKYHTTPPTNTTTYPYKTPHHYGRTSQKHVPFTMTYHHPTENPINAEPGSASNASVYKTTREEERSASAGIFCKAAAVVWKKKAWCKMHALLCNMCSPFFWWP